MQSQEVNSKNIFYPPGGILMWIIVFLELITFGMALIAMAVYSKQEPQIFHNSRLLLNTTFGAINTVFLITSGFLWSCLFNILKKISWIKPKYI